MRRIGAVVCVAVLTWFSATELRSEEVLDNAAIVKMVRAGLSAELVEMKVKSTAGRYDVSADGLIALKSAGVPDAVMAAMLKKSESAPAPAAPATPPASKVGATAAAPSGASPAVIAVAPVAPAQQSVPVVVAIAEMPPVCADVQYEIAGDKAFKRTKAHVCVESDAIAIADQRLPFTSLRAHCRERSLGFPYTGDPDEWRVGDGTRIYRIFGSEREISSFSNAVTARAATVAGGNCSTREMQRVLAVK